MGAPFEQEPLAGQLVLLARAPSEEDEDEQSFALRVPQEATLPLLRALRRSLETTKAEVNGDRPMWYTLFERFGAGGSDLVAPSECSPSSEGSEALRVRLAAAEARLAAASLRYEEELQEMRCALDAKTGAAEEGPKRSPTSLSRPPRTARTPPRPNPGGARQQEPSPACLQEEPALQNFSLSAEFWRLREALTHAEANEHQKVSDMEVRRLRTALAATTAKLERYEASSVEDSHRIVVSLSDGLSSASAAKVEPDTARTVVAGPDLILERREQPSPGKPRQSQLGGLGAKIRPVARTSTSLVSPARQGFSPSLLPRSSSPAGPRHTMAELTSAPPQRAVQLSPTPMRAPATGQTAIQAPSPSKLPARLSGSASARLTPSIPGQVSSPAPRVYNVMRSVHASPHTQGTVRVVSNIQGTTSAPASVHWTTPRPGPDRPLTPVAGVVQRVTPPPLAAMRKSSTLSRTGSLSPPPMYAARRETTYPSLVTVQNKVGGAQFVELSI